MYLKQILITYVTISLITTCNVARYVLKMSQVSVLKKTFFGASFFFYRKLCNSTVTRLLILDSGLSSGSRWTKFSRSELAKVNHYRRAARFEQRDQIVFYQGQLFMVVADKNGWRCCHGGKW